MSLLAELRQRKDEIIAIAQKHGVNNIQVFGSVARGEEGPDSDVDFLIELLPQASALDMVGFQQETEALFGRHCDVLTPTSLHWYIRDKVLKEAQPL